ncbi:hypothetical protein SEA_YABOI_209 [Streptomyces phage Yaboi]|uniref:Uncharacterized protein n=1 Tax=Streptomyces phage Yaboi TaxID=2301621 RepID=A0A385UIA0_9CAUD|nr:hypothetical protein HWB86_gp113 [Streptomyces phage Yaboi]AYB71006.1 hypothetical protein SEA_YABOI_209 [Streptomyces phage Yaboi]UVD40014.1 hypothetical protein SEA_STANIMAL_204 [Streptomyces phage Stanimal]WNM73756.1 hypothetical protein SEA_SOLLERTIA_205 [Streptomyces phage Sollertia]
MSPKTKTQAPLEPAINAAIITDCPGGKDNCQHDMGIRTHTQYT